MTFKKFRDFDYEVNTNGIVRRIKTKKELKQGDIYGYKNICLSKNGKHYFFRVHRIVAELFIPNTNNHPQINHKNGIKSDNRVENIEWCSPSYNVTHSYKELNRTRIKSDVNSVLMYDSNGNLLNEFISLSSCAKILNLSKGNISQCCNNKRKTVGGYIFKYGNINRNKNRKLC